MQRTFQAVPTDGKRSGGIIVLLFRLPFHFHSICPAPKRCDLTHPWNFKKNGPADSGIRTDGVGRTPWTTTWTFAFLVTSSLVSFRPSIVSLSASSRLRVMRFLHGPNVLQMSSCQDYVCRLSRQSGPSPAESNPETTFPYIRSYLLPLRCYGKE